MSTTIHSTNADVDRVWARLAEIDFCMFVTHGRDGSRGRPMSSIPRRDEGLIFFLTEHSGRLVDEIRANPAIALSYGNGSNTFAWVTAEATISADRALVERLWSPGAQAFWPQGPKDSDVVAVIARPGAAELWDGPNGLVASVKMMMALATRTEADMGDKKVVHLQTGR
jgi:general stress protein 26